MKNTKWTFLITVCWVILVGNTQASLLENSDFDGSGRIDFLDFLLFAQAFDSTQPKFDLDDNAKVGFADFLIFSSFFGKSITARIIFSDTKLENVIRTAINKPLGDIFPNEVAHITELSLRGINNLSGIEYCSGLKTLSVIGAQALRLDELKGLISLTEIDIKVSQVEDLSSLSHLENLEILVIFANNVKDLSALKGLTILDL